MNEVTRIHLGRQSFTIAVDAHKILKTYLAEIEAMGGDDVVREVELRMAELLGERGIGGDKVVLLEDVEFLQQQLGKPTDFSDTDAEPTEAAAASEQPAKRLFRDTDNALLAGVSSGLANYFGIDAVIVRILFVVLTLFSGGAGILIYIVLWLLVPAAETSSEKLQMRGLPVTVDALKKSISDADFPGTARRTSTTALKAINSIFGVLLKLIGTLVIIGSIAALFGIIIVKIYMMLHHGQLFEENLFPVGSSETWLANLGLVLAALCAVFGTLVGLTIVRRKWPIRAWATIPLVGLLLATSAVTAAFAADVGPRVNARYHAGMHVTAVKDIAPFDKVVSTGDLDIEFVPAASQSVSLRYFDHPDISNIKFSVKDKVLTVDTTRFDRNRHCDMLCLFPRYNMVIQVAAPNVEHIDANGAEVFYPPVPPR